jgi:hypothetical protein
MDSMRDFVAILRGLALLIAVLALAACHSTGAHRPSSGSVSVESDHARVSVSFGDRERRHIREYYAGRGRGLPPGLAKQGKVPPGIAKQLRREQRLPPGADPQPLPNRLSERLGPAPAGYLRARVGFDVVLLEAETRVVVDLIEGVAGED